MSELKKVVTCDDLMEEFITDSIIEDDELSESIFTCIDNYIDDICIDTIDNENSLFETDCNSAETPFTYILDKVMEKVDTIENIQDDSYCKVLEKELGLNKAYEDEKNNYDDPDYCTGVDFDEITPEDFQLYLPNTTNDGIDEEGTDEATYNSNIFDDANFNA